MHENRPQFGRELKADEMTVGLGVVVDYRAMTVIELTNVTVRVVEDRYFEDWPINPPMVVETRAYIYGILPDGHMIDDRGKFVHVFENAGPSREPRSPIKLPYLSSNSSLIGRKLMADELQPNTTVVVYTPDLPTPYRTMWVAQVNERTVDFRLSQNEPKALPYTVQPNKTLKNHRGWHVKVFEYLGQP